MRIVFFGSNEMSSRALLHLLRKREEIVGIYTLPQSIQISYAPRPVELVTHADLHTLSRRFHVPVVEVRDRMSEYVEGVKLLQPDLLLVIGWYYMVPRAMREVAPLGCVGLHPSLLPKYRGGAPVNWTLINGERETGLTMFYLEDEPDAGDIIAQARIEILLADTCRTLYQKVIDAALSMLEDQLPLLREGKANRIPQDHSAATVFPQRCPEDGQIDWDRSALDLYNWIRALTRPYPGAFTTFRGERLIIWEAAFYGFGRQSGPPGEILEIVQFGKTVGFTVSGKQGDLPLLITSVRTDAGGDLTAQAFVERYRVSPGERFC